MAGESSASERKRLWFAALFVVLLPLAFHLPYFSGERILWAADTAQLQFPRYKILCDALQEEHALPLWQTWLYTGSPFHANPENPTLYPPVLLFASFLGPVATINATILLHLSVAALGMFCLVRRLWLRVRPEESATAVAGGCIGACVFALAYTTRIDHLNLVAYGATHALVPWVLLAADALLDGPRPRRAAGCLGLLLGFQVLSGGLYLIPYMALVLAAWMVFLGLFGGRERARRTIVFGAIAAMCAALIVAGKYLPYREWIETTNRAGKLDYMEALGSSLGGKDGNFAWIEVWNQVAVCTFYGATIALALLALPLWRMRVVMVALALTAIFFLVGLGGNVHQFFYEHVPLFDQTRNAKRAWVGVNALLPLLAGLGACGLIARFRALREKPGRAVGIGILGAAALAPFLAYSFRVDDQVRHPERLSELTARYVQWPRAAEKCGKEWRAMYVDKLAAKDRNEQFISTLLEVETPAGYLGHVWPLDLERHLYGSAEKPLEDEIRYRRRSTLSVRWQVSMVHAPGDDEEKRPPPLRVDGNQLLENELARPRAIEPSAVAGVYGDVESEVAYALLDTGNFPLRNAGTVQFARDRELSAAELGALDRLFLCGEATPQAEAAAAAFAAAGKIVVRVRLPLSSEDRARVLAEEQHLAELEELERNAGHGLNADGFERVSSSATLVKRTDAARGRWVVVSEPWAMYPGWSATAGSGAMLSIERADGVSSAVFVPAGEASFRADYAPRSVTRGLWCFVAGLIAALLLAVWPERKLEVSG